MARVRRIAIVWLVALGIAGALFAAVALESDESTHSFNIDGQPLGDALQELAIQGDVQVVFFSSLVAGLEAPAIHGHYTVTAALDVLLAKSGLTYRLINPKTIEIRRSEPAVQPQHEIARLPKPVVKEIAPGLVVVLVEHVVHAERERPVPVEGETTPQVHDRVCRFLDLVNVAKHIPILAWA